MLRAQIVSAALADCQTNVQSKSCDPHHQEKQATRRNRQGRRFVQRSAQNFRSERQKLKE